MREETQWRLLLINTAQRWVSNRDDAEDIVQNALVRFWQRMHCLPREYPDEQVAKNFCYRLVHEAAVDFLRIRRRTPRTTPIELLPSDYVTWDPLSERFERIFIGAQIESLFSVLSANQQKVLILLCEGYTHSEIANTLHMHPGTVKRHLERIRQKAAAMMSTGSNPSSELFNRGAKNAELHQSADQCPAFLRRKARGGGGTKRIDSVGGSCTLLSRLALIGFSTAYLSVAIPLWNHPDVQSSLDKRYFQVERKESADHVGCNSPTNHLSEQEIRQILQANRERLMEEVNR